MSDDLVRVYFPATIPRDQLPALAALVTGQDDDILLDFERVVNGGIDRVYPGTEWYDRVEFDAPVEIAFVLREDVTLVTDLVDGQVDA